MSAKTPTEQALMFFLTGLTNFCGIPALYMIYKKKLYFQLHIGLFTMITSFMYHSMESLDVQKFYLTVGGWHKLDNIGSIMCFIILMVYYMDNLQLNEHGEYTSPPSSHSDMHLNMVGLFIVLLMQTNHPWHLENTVVPILIFVGLCVVKNLLVRKARFNSYYLKIGGFMQIIAIVFFVRGLDETTDYLRMHHAMWHCFSCLASFYLWQAIDKDKEDKSVKIVSFSRQQRYNLITELKEVMQVFNPLYLLRNSIKSLKT